MTFKLRALSLFIFLLAASLLAGGQVKAATGCCAVITTNKTTGSISKVYFELEKTECDKRTNSLAGVVGVYEEGKLAADKNSCIAASKNGIGDQEAVSRPIVPPTLSVAIPGFGKFSEVKCAKEDSDCSIPWIGEYITGIYKYSLLIIGILSAIMLMIGGVIYITAAGNRQQIGRATDFIKGSVVGLALAFCSYLILFILNPNLTIFSPLKLQQTEGIPLEEVNDAINNHGQTSEPISGNTGPGNRCKESEWVTIPNDKKGLGIWNPGGSKACPDTAALLTKAAACMKKKNPQYIIRIADGSRTLKEQAYQFATKPKGQACDPAKGVAGCPHTSGVAFDAWGCLASEGAGCKNHDRQYDLQECMMQAGYCLLSIECWHFEYPHFQRKCVMEHNFNGYACTGIKK